MPARIPDAKGSSGFRAVWNFSCHQEPKPRWFSLLQRSLSSFSSRLSPHRHKNDGELDSSARYKEKVEEEEGMAAEIEGEEGMRPRWSSWEIQGTSGRRTKYGSQLGLPEVYWPGGKKGLTRGFNWWGESDPITLRAQKEYFRRQRRLEKALVARESEPSLERFLEAKRGGEKWKRDKIQWLAETLPHIQTNSCVKILNAQRPWIATPDVVSLIHLLAEKDQNKIAVAVKMITIALGTVYKWVRVMPFYRHDPQLLKLVRTLTNERLN